MVKQLVFRVQLRMVEKKHLSFGRKLSVHTILVSTRSEHAEKYLLNGCVL